MLNEVKYLEDLFNERDPYIEGYVSTDEAELNEALLWVEYEDYNRDLEREFDLIYIDSSMGGSVKHKKTGLEIDYSDIPVSQARKELEKFGFTPMSRFRLYLNGNRKINNILSPILRELSEMRQNVVIVNPKETKMYRVLSEFYC